MHVFQALVEFLLVPHEAVPELVLPQRPPAAAPFMQTPSHDLLGVVQHLPEKQGILGLDQSMPVVGHENVCTEQKPQPLAGLLQHLD